MMELLAGTLAENNFGDTRTGGLAGPTGLVIILLLIIGTILLIRNMNQRLRRLPHSFASGKADAESAVGATSTSPVTDSTSDPTA